MHLGILRLFFFCHAHGMQTFPDQVWNLSHSSNTTKSLTRYATRKLQVSCWGLSLVAS